MPASHIPSEPMMVRIGNGASELEGEPDTRPKPAPFFQGASMPICVRATVTVSRVNSDYILATLPLPQCQSLSLLHPMGLPQSPGCPALGIQHCLLQKMQLILGPGLMVQSPLAEEWPVFTCCHPAVGTVTSEGELSSGVPLCLYSLTRSAHAVSKCWRGKEGIA